jgi:prolyl-tRNA synthetase
MVTVATRYNREKQLVLKTDVVKMMPALLQTIHQRMYEKALNDVKEKTYYVSNYEQFKEKIKQGGYIAMSVHPEAEAIIKTDTQATARVIPFDQSKLESLCPVTGKQATQVIMFARAY